MFFWRADILCCGVLVITEDTLCCVRFISDVSEKFHMRKQSFKIMKYLESSFLVCDHDVVVNVWYTMCCEIYEPNTSLWLKAVHVGCNAQGVNLQKVRQTARKACYPHKRQPHDQTPIVSYTENESVSLENDIRFDISDYIQKRPKRFHIGLPNVNNRNKGSNVC